ncbi:MAG TPA: fimbria/pilus periplasmic chaperone [Holophagaceae bacterium]|jgi:P pilus assembly chaperone PapD|nr:fimbria/pilus periplasmic chaperone [Holophagaceae bacterium]
MREWIPVLLATLMAASGSAQAPAPAASPAATQDQGGAGDLLVAPTRLVIENGQHVAEVALFNQGSTPGTYRISLLRTQMSSDGSITEGPAPADGSVDPVSLFRYSPHQVTLQPGETQIIRIALRKPAQLPDGEYRVHLQFLGLPPVEAPKPKSDQPQKGLSVVIKPVFGVSIPLILRQGNLSATANLSGLAIQADAQGHSLLKMNLDREGNASVYGDLKAVFTATGGPTQPVGELNGVAVYTPLASRSVSFRLDPPAGMSLRHGTLAVSFVDEKTHATLATATLAVP